MQRGFDLIARKDAYDGNAHVACINDCAVTMGGAMRTREPTHDAQLRVVLVDDDTKLLTALTELLGEYDIHVAALATDGSQALTALDTATAAGGEVSALVIDERMPFMNGIDATRMVRRFHPTLPVILYSVYAGFLGDAPRQAGVTVQVDKAAHPLRLIDAIRQAGAQPPRPPLPPGAPAAGGGTTLDDSLLRHAV